MKRILRKITNWGTQYADSKSEKRNVIMTNYTSLVGSIALMPLIASLFFYYGPNTSVLGRLVTASLVFLVPLALNRFGHIIISRVILSWLTPVIVFGVSILDLKAGEQYGSSSFVGLRLFLLAGFCFPFLIFNLKNKIPLILALSVSMLSFIFFDQIFILFDVGFRQIVSQDSFYAFNNMRAIVATLAIGLTLFFLKSVVEKNEEWNQQLLNELESKNKLIRQQAEAEVYKLNEELSSNLQLLSVSEAKFRGAFEHSAIGMALVSTDSKWLQVNKELCQIVGYSEEELLNTPAKDITHPEDIDGDKKTQQQLLQGEQDTIQREKRYIHRDGSIVWVNLNASIVYDAAGVPLFFVAQIENITSEKKAAEQLMIQEANLKATINNTEVMIWSVDNNYNLLMFNNPFANYILKHYGVHIKIGSRVFWSLQAPFVEEMANKWRPYYLKALEGKRITFEETRFGINLQYSLSPIIEMDKVIGVSIFADNVTERVARDRELADANRKIGELKLMALRSVMSPHFIFNVLNSIQYYIAKSDRLNAMNYLASFSKLIRSILNHSVNNKIKLSEEIELLQNYVNLEMTRFENKFSFSLAVNPEIELESIVIPSLLIQPYVENAIIHGLYNKQGAGELAIRIEENDGILFFEIEDNGVGRKEAMKLHKYNFPSYTSMGSSLTEERLKLIHQDNKSSFEIVDLMNLDQACGTKVKIKIPYDPI
jgi:PAS domain S-box-containing protein